MCNAGGWREPREIDGATHVSASTDRVIDHLASMSWIAGLAAASATGAQMAR